MMRRSLKTPRAAAVAGILFALLYGAALVLIRLSIPDETAADSGAWLETNSGTIAFALNLVPYAGIAFLWFIGVIRDRLGDSEDRFFATVFLGSGLLFLALTFVGAALAGALLTSYAGAARPRRQRSIYLRPRRDVRNHQRLCHSHGRCVHDLAEHHLAPHRPDASRLGIRNLRPGAGVAR